MNSYKLILYMEETRSRKIIKSKFLTSPDLIVCTHIPAKPQDTTHAYLVFTLIVGDFIKNMSVHIYSYFCWTPACGKL